MYEITSQIYEKTAAKLKDLVAGYSYYSGTMEFAFEDTECRMVLSLIIYYKQVELPEKTYTVIADIVPVWWEFHTVIDGEERINDFDFALLKEYLL